MPVDNLSPDKDGAIYGAGFPDGLQFMKSTGNPERVDSPTTVWRFRREGQKGVVGEGEYVAEKVVEDAQMGDMAGATVAVHDVETGRIFTGGKFRRLFLFSIGGDGKGEGN